MKRCCSSFGCSRLYHIPCYFPSAAIRCVFFCKKCRAIDPHCFFLPFLARETVTVVILLYVHRIKHIIQKESQKIYKCRKKVTAAVKVSDFFIYAKKKQKG